jgi:hypothetical protein
VEQSLDVLAEKYNRKVEKTAVSASRCSTLWIGSLRTHGKIRSKSTGVRRRLAASPVDRRLFTAVSMTPRRRLLRVKS